MDSFRRSVLLQGWSELSIWGYDEAMQTYFAQLWRDGEDSDDEPTIWIMGLMPIESVEALLLKVSSALGEPLDIVQRAMLHAPGTVEPVARAS